MADTTDPRSAEDGATDALVIAVDGPSGAGKSTVSRTVARTLGLRYLDTGATYRAVTWWVLQRGISPADAGTISELVRTDALPVIDVRTDPDEPGISVDGADVEPAIRGPEVTGAVSAVSAVPAVRAYLVQLQRSLIGSGGIVVEGRDIGTVVTPDAPVKIFLTADPGARAARRAAEGTTGTDTAETLVDLARRDRLDSSRAVAPLEKAGDAHEVDTTAHDLPQVVQAVLDIVRGAREPRGRRTDDAEDVSEVLLLDATQPEPAAPR